MPRRGTLRPIIIRGPLIFSSLLFMVLAWSGASAQMGTIGTAQSDLVKKPAVEQAAILAEVVRGAWKANKCANAKVSLEKTYNDRSGGWLVSCDDGLDYWALVRNQSKSVAMVLPCIMARQSGTDCYANIRTVRPGDIEQCASSTGLLDHVIQSCTAIIQSHQFDNKPDGIFTVYALRALAFARYSQLDLAIADFDKAVAMRPDHIETRYNRAVALERKGEFDQALMDLAKVIDAKPKDVNALHERGYVHMKKGEYDLAIGDFDRVLSIDPGFENATRNRAEAVKAKANPVQPSAKAATVEAASLPTTSDEQAVYCMEASFGYTERLTRLVAILRDNREKGQALLGGTNVPPSARAQLAAQMKSLDESIASNDAKRKTWDANTTAFITYMQKHGLTKDSTLIASMSGQVRRDQEAVQSTYGACLRGCAPNDSSCKATCNEKAESSDANMRMLRCSEVAAQFK